VTFVLVAEDEESISDALSYMLRKEGFEVAVCPTSPDALAAFDTTGLTWCCPASCAPGRPAPKCARACASGRVCR
jgi:two-component system response regulator RegX3